MDLAVAWYQEEQEGEAKRIWSNIWETAEVVSGFDSIFIIYLIDCSLACKVLIFCLFKNFFYVNKKFKFKKLLKIIEIVEKMLSISILI